MNDNAQENEPRFPMRINKYLAMEGRGSRREMDKLVEDGKVLINGRIAALGDKVDEGDKVEIRFKGTKERERGRQHALERRDRRSRRRG